MSGSRKRKRRKKLEAPFLSPRLIIDVENDSFGFFWPGLKLKRSRQGKGDSGLGVFATQGLHAGLKLPVLGRATSQEEFVCLEEEHKDTHVFRTKGKDYPFVDGHPRHEPFHGVGGNGLYIALMVNEPSRGKPNCVFRGNFMQIAQDIRDGEELTISYGGEDYRRIGYKPSIYCMRKCAYPKLDKFR